MDKWKASSVGSGQFKRKNNKLKSLDRYIKAQTKLKKNLLSLRDVRLKYLTNSND